MTGGVDSRAVAVALRDLEVPFAAFTFVADLGSMQDAAASAAVTEPLSLPHDLREIALWDEGIALRAAEADALWSDGCAPIGLGSIPWPQDLSHWVVGVGAEVGRAFYYRWSSPRPGVPSRRLLERILASDMELDLGGARLDVRTRLRSRAREWVDAAYETGHTGWSVLDVLYGEQRVRRWARALAPRLPAAYVTAYASQPLMRALASLPLEDRLNDGFARRFIAERQPSLVPAAPAMRSTRASPLLRRELIQRLRGLRRGLWLPPLGRVPQPWHAQPPWTEHHAVIDWMRDEVLTSGIVDRSMGPRWQREVRANFIRGEPHAAYLASWIAAPVALASVLGRARVGR